ncbi:tetraacyldisaccharide 4'-kinase [Dysgonomonas sp. ZJ709]|uniref:tetraacyldisaccharide 4'-kinase n=1 Tax=Dysgonomonas sp. ZJ709 TaxID=2709797 RepID=UPI0013EA6683|nr:tetraacyldisaccharide 4'-kinase [Dysgonomonas sp. ZJ709]
MITNPPVRINKWLLPFSWLYGLIVFFRNKLFDWKILKHEEFDIPVICIGNITAGGTGKTPHTEYLIEILQDKYRVAVLSRGYKRKTKGFVLATSESTSLEIGDESFQIKQKYPNAIIAVDGNRRRGINELLALEKPPQIILLDDAFQHRYVKPSYTIILSDYNRPIYEDKLLPAGRLRESAMHVRKASMVIVTKCPQKLQPIEYRIISHNINTFPYQSLFFTSFNYQNLKPVFSENEQDIDLDYLNDKDILLVTGIASPKMIIEKLSEYTNKVETMIYPDHHAFKARDIKDIANKFEAIQSVNKIILVTEKDAARLILRDDIDEQLKPSFYYLPIEVVFSDEESKQQFKDKIYKHVKENTGNRAFYKR